jgi:hypothetical protein
MTETSFSANQQRLGFFLRPGGNTHNTVEERKREREREESKNKRKIR